MSETISRSDFENALRTALTNLYDPVILQDSALVSAFGLDARPDAIVALRGILVAAIESLRPGEDVPAQSMAWRYFHILYGRFTEQLTQIEISNDLGLSVRQMRRHEKRASAGIGRQPLGALPAGNRMMMTMPSWRRRRSDAKRS